MSEKTTTFYRGNTEVSVDFSAQGISSDGAVVLLDKLERKHKVIARMAGLIPDRRDTSKVTHSVENSCASASLPLCKAMRTAMMSTT